MKLMSGVLSALALVAMLSTEAFVSMAEAASPKRVQISGEVIDTWCYSTEIMYALGTAHYQCSVWCAIGGVPVSIKGDDGNVYVLLRLEDNDSSVAVHNPKIVKIQGHQVTVDGDLYERDGVKYLFVDLVADDKGLINITHEEFGIQPFGQ